MSISNLIGLNFSEIQRGEEFFCRTGHLNSHCLIYPGFLRLLAAARASLRGPGDQVESAVYSLGLRGEVASEVQLAADDCGTHKRHDWVQLPLMQFS